MSDIRAIRVLNLIGKKEELLKWSEKFLAKTQRSGVKDILLGRLTIPETNHEINEEMKMYKGKTMMKIFCHTSK
jgi:hypothetical protein